MSDGGSFIVLNSYDDSEVTTFLENSIRSNPPSGYMTQDEILRNIAWLGQLFEYSSGMIQQASEIIDNVPKDSQKKSSSDMTSIADIVHQHVVIRNLKDEKDALLKENMELNQKLHEQSEQIRELQNMDASQPTLVPDGVTREEYDRVVKEAQEQQEADKTARLELLTEVGKWLKQRKPEGLNVEEDYKKWIKQEVESVLLDRAVKAKSLSDKEMEIEGWKEALKDAQNQQESSVKLLTNQLDSLQTQLKIAEELNHELEIQLKTTQSALSAKEEDYRREHDKLCEYERQSTENQPQTAKLMQDLQESQSRVRELEQKLRLADDVKVLLQKRLRNTEGERDETRRLCAEKEKTNAQWMTKCQNLEDTLTRLQTPNQGVTPSERTPVSSSTPVVPGRGQTNRTSTTTSPASADSSSLIIADECPQDLLAFIRRAKDPSANSSHAKQPPTNANRRNA